MCFDHITFFMVTAIGAEAFKNCTQLTDITIPPLVYTIGSAAFGFDAGKAPASRSYTFRGDVPGAIGASAIPITVTHIPTIKYYENYIGFTTVDWAGYTKAVILEKPTLTDPTATNTGTPTVDISWAAVTNATGYQVYFSKKGDLSDATITPVTEAKAKIETGLEPRQLYYFAVKAQDAHGESLLSEVKSERIPAFEVTGVTLDKETLSVGVTKMAQLNATVEPANATDQTLKWTSEKDTVATVDANGLVTGISEGTAIIRVSTPDYTFSKICTVTVTEGYDVSVTDNKATITKYYGDNKDVVIPDTIDVNGTPAEVVAIGASAFYNSGVTRVTIPARVTSIGAIAFKNCANLTTVTFKSGSQLSIIGNSSFMGSYALSSIVLPDTVTSIGDYAFGDCSDLRTLTLPASLTTIGINAFYFTGLTAITIPSQVTSIPISAFYGCQGLTTIDLPVGLQTIGNTAFALTDFQTPIARTFTFNGDAPTLGTAAIPPTSGSAITTIKYPAIYTGFNSWTDYTLEPIS
ncbi:leucine-rich repeat protein [Acetobacterium carbinolicum]|uniref:leucine-rich repeat protein n=1 Tax=Acetobacterium carbinolicum TaxID=52690 RepID=UPI003BF48335